MVFGLSDKLTGHFDFLHYLAGSVVDIHFNINGITMVINLGFRKDLQSKTEGGETSPAVLANSFLVYLFPK